jgi:hypothetical protein
LRFLETVVFVVVFALVVVFLAAEARFTTALPEFFLADLVVAT